jgi:hypothetical protein
MIFSSKLGTVIEKAIQVFSIYPKYKKLHKRFIWSCRYVFARTLLSKSRKIQEIRILGKILDIYYF